jgi:hypothetical protein
MQTQVRNGNKFPGGLLIGGLVSITLRPLVSVKPSSPESWGESSFLSAWSCVCPLTSSTGLSGRGVGLTGSRYGDSSVSTLRSSWPYHVFRKLIIFISIFHRFTHVYTSVANPDPRSGAFLPPGSEIHFFRIQDPNPG